MTSVGTNSTESFSVSPIVVHVNWEQLINCLFQQLPPPVLNVNSLVLGALEQFKDQAALEQFDDQVTDQLLCIGRIYEKSGTMQKKP